MSITKLLKIVSVLALAAAFTVGCTGTTESEGVSKEQEAIDAIAAAKKANAKAKSVNYEWRDTGKIIKGAEKSLADKDYENAIKQANKARRQAENAIAQQQAESNRLAAMFESSAPAQPEPTPTAAGSSQYTVVKGDNLWNISAKPSIYNNPYQWPLIYKANSSKIKDADLIYPGQNFDINSNPSSAETSAAITHAKTRGAWSLGVVEESDKAYLAK